MQQTPQTQSEKSDRDRHEIPEKPSLPQGMGTFTTIWFGQVVSLLGSSLTSFALSIWVYQQTNSVTQFSFPILAAVLPPIFIGPIAGVYIDRWSRRWTMIISDFCAGLCTLILAWLYITHHLEIWHICLLNICTSSFGTFQGLASSAATTLLVPKDKLSRASGMTQTGQALSSLTAPSLAVVLLGTIQFQGIVAIDLISLLFALLILAMVRFPEITPKTDSPSLEESFWQRLTFGWHYFLQRPGLLGLLLLVSLCNFLIGATQVLDTPLILSFASIATLGIIVSCGNAGMIVGGLVLSFWGGLGNQMNIIFLSMSVIGLSILVAGLRPTAVLLAGANFSLLLMIPIVNGTIQAIYQRKVAPEVQGRVFAFRKSAALAALPFSYLLAGPLADRVFEPLMTQDTMVARSIGWAIGTGPGRGIGLLFICMGFLTILVTAIAAFFPRLRDLEEELPDAIANGEWSADD